MELLKYQGNLKKLNQQVFTFDEFVRNKLYERMDADIKSTSDVVLSPSQDDVLNAVGSKIEQICGWEIEVFKKYLAEKLGTDKITHRDIVRWIMLEADKYYKGEVSIKGKEYLKPNKIKEFTNRLIGLDYYMIVEKLMRRLKGLAEDDRPTPIYIKQMVDLVADCVPEDEDEEEE